MRFVLLIMSVAFLLYAAVTVPHSERPWLVEGHPCLDDLELPNVVMDADAATEGLWDAARPAQRVVPPGARVSDARSW